MEYSYAAATMAPNTHTHTQSYTHTHTHTDTQSYTHSHTSHHPVYQMVFVLVHHGGTETQWSTFLPHEPDDSLFNMETACPSS